MSAYNDGRQNYQNNQRQTFQNVPVKKPDFLNPDSDFVEEAKKVMEGLRKTNKWGAPDFGDLTTSKIRNILSMVSGIYNDVTIAESKLPPSMVNKIRYLKVRLAYEAGRDKSYSSDIKNFIEKTGLLTAIDFIGDSKDNFVRYSQYLEALVAYHRYLGGKD